ncbi:MAG: hypothetical protein KGH64_06075 [Candidatus Micrarchaeota archaeon]|nr:hypothetical protein [Candidatus Micrarchaeota archaeon]MDE1859203.1 hypothetical protein [Candidatus Micrarchaeota archaeon]
MTNQRERELIDRIIKFRNERAGSSTLRGHIPPKMAAKVLERHYGMLLTAVNNNQDRFNEDVAYISRKSNDNLRWRVALGFNNGLPFVKVEFGNYG